MLIFYLGLFSLMLMQVSSASIKSAIAASSLNARTIPGGIELPITRTLRRRDATGTIGLGDIGDLLYTVPIEVNGVTTPVHLDTGSSDLWTISDKCAGGTCGNTSPSIPRLASSTLNNSGVSVTMQYGDSTTGTTASGPVAFSTASIAGISIGNQAFVAANASNNPVLASGASGILGLSFPAGSAIQLALTQSLIGPITTTDAFFGSTDQFGPLLSRISDTNQLESPVFAISLQRDMIEIGGGGTGTFTLGALPPGINNSSLTWVNVRLYSQSDGGSPPPSSTPNEIMPFRWEVDIDAVFIDGKQLSASTIPATGGVNGTRLSALIDTGNSLIRGPQDNVQAILSAVGADPTTLALLCNVPHTLAFMIGGQLFKVDPRDFITQSTTPSLSTQASSLECLANNIVATDPPGSGHTFSWSLGDPFFKSNLVAFHMGNLTHPSVDPPRIGFLNTVPANASADLQQDVSEAAANNGNFESTVQTAPTSIAAALTDVTVGFGQTTTAGQTQSAVPTLATPPSATTPSTTLQSSGPISTAGTNANSAGVRLDSIQGTSLLALIGIFWLLL